MTRKWYLGAALLLFIGSEYAGTLPAWWTSPATQILVSGGTANNYALANNGQLKFVAYQAKLYLDATFPDAGGAGPDIDALVANFEPIPGVSYTSQQLADINRINHAPLVVRHLNNVAKLFYDRLNALGYSTKDNLIDFGYPANWSSIYPWPGTIPPTTSADYSPVTIGQLKMVFSFDLDNLPTWWKTRYFPGASSVSPTDDADGDGLTNLQEFQRGTDPTKIDSDYDGISDSAEIAAGTNPNGNGDVTPMRLGYWQFPSGAHDYGSAGQSPLTETSREVETSPWGTALKISLSGSSLLTYRDVEANGNANINLQKGSVRLWIKPNWNSTAGGVTGGPGSWARVLEFGSYTVDASYGLWAIHFDPDDTYFWISTQNELHQSSGFATSTFSWQSGQWHQIVVTYSSTQTKFYIDSVLVGSGAGLTAIPNAVIRSLGFSIGTDRYATQRTNASIDELETFNYELSASEILANYQMTTPDPNATGLPSLTDTDGDGLPDTYQAGLSGQGASGDNDGDGLTNLTEYLAGSGPLTSDGMGTTFTATGLKVYTPIKP